MKLSDLFPSLDETIAKELKDLWEHTTPYDRILLITMVFSKGGISEEKVRTFLDVVEEKDIEYYSSHYRLLVKTSKEPNNMTFTEYVQRLANIEGKEALEKFTKDFWLQASDEQRGRVIRAILRNLDKMPGVSRKMAIDFWDLCGIHIAENGWVCIDGKNYCLSSTMVPDIGATK